MTWPNFMVIGAEKAGTTSLDFYLQQHPQIYMSPLKEPRYFAPEFYTKYYHGPRVGKRTRPMTLEQYLELFCDRSHELAIGEISPQYLYLPGCAQRIFANLPNAKIIAILRNPVDRAFSAYAYQIRCGFDTDLTFEAALDQEALRVEENWRPVWHYLTLGFYYEQLKRYFEQFPAQNIKVVLYDDLVSDANAFAADIYTFLGVDANFLPDTTAQNVSGRPKNRWLHRLLYQDNPLKESIKLLLPQKARKSLAHFVKQKNMGSKPTLSPSTRLKLQQIYRDDILKLQALIQKDISHWLV